MKQDRKHLVKKLERDRALKRIYERRWGRRGEVRVSDYVSKTAISKNTQIQDEEARTSTTSSGNPNFFSVSVVMNVQGSLLPDSEANLSGPHQKLMIVLKTALVSSATWKKETFSVTGR
jgi:hypothetical protein